MWKLIRLWMVSELVRLVIFIYPKDTDASTVLLPLLDQISQDAKRYADAVRASARKWHQT